jgi:hypothetical protein
MAKEQNTISIITNVQDYAESAINIGIPLDRLLFT